MTSIELTSALTVIANAIACNLTVDEITLLAGIFVQLGDTLATIAALESLCPDQDDKKTPPKPL